MKKILLFLPVLLALWFLAHGNNNVSSGAQNENLKSVRVQSNALTQEETSAPSSRAKVGAKQPTEPALNSIDHLAILRDARLSFDSRLDSWEALDRSLPNTANLLYSFVISKNPYTGESQAAHDHLSLQFSQEESFRIMALESLEKLAIKDARYSNYLEAVAKNALSPSLKNLSQRMIPYARRGMSYSLLVQQALGDMK